MGSDFQMAEIHSLPERHAIKANEERSTYFPQAIGGNSGPSPNNRF